MLDSFSEAQALPSGLEALRAGSGAGASTSLLGLSIARSNFLDWQYASYSCKHIVLWLSPSIRKYDDVFTHSGLSAE